jgi:hypothetical protein
VSGGGVGQFTLCAVLFSRTLLRLATIVGVGPTFLIVISQISL